MYRVVVVDDEQMICDKLERMINDIPNVSVVAKLANGLEAKKYLENHMVDVVFSDIRMPVMDGLELMSYLHSCRQECQTVLISAYDDFYYAQQAMKLGVRHYLLKPIKKDEVVRTVELLLEERITREKEMLWKHDMKIELQELELYHALVSDENSIESKMKRKLYYAKYVVRDELIAGSEELLQVAWLNILRWCAPLCISVIVERKEDELQYILLSDTIDFFPEASEVQERGETLLGKRVLVQRIECTEIKELIQNKTSPIVQDELTDLVIDRAKEYIAQNLHRNISRADVAAEVYLEPAYFGKYFTRKCGINFQDYLQRERIEKSKELLCCGYKVKEVVERVGFTNRNYFNKIFRLHVGYSPLEYRRYAGRKENV